MDKEGKISSLFERDHPQEPRGGKAKGAAVIHASN
jgi:hypothetical protein